MARSMKSEPSATSYIVEADDEVDQAHGGREADQAEPARGGAIPANQRLMYAVRSAGTTVTTNAAVTTSARRREAALDRATGSRSGRCSGPGRRRRARRCPPKSVTFQKQDAEADERLRQPGVGPLRRGAMKVTAANPALVSQPKTSAFMNALLDADVVELELEAEEAERIR